MSSNIFKKGVWKTSILNELNNELTAVENSTPDASIAPTTYTASSEAIDVNEIQNNTIKFRNVVKKIANDLSEKINGAVYALYRNATRNIPHSDVADGTLWKTFAEVVQVMAERNISPNNCVFEVSPAIHKVLKEEAITLGVSEVLTTGNLDTLFGVRVSVTNDIVEVVDDLGNVAHKCLLRTKDAFSCNLEDFDVTINENVVIASYKCGAEITNVNGFILIDCRFPH